jgi:putative ABC transport system substrate-binding protein
LALLASAATLGWPVRLVAQPSGQVRRIGILMGVAEDSPEGQTRIAAFREGLRSAGWTEGGNLQVDLRWAGGDMGRIRALAAELVATAPAAILANGTPAVAALKELTRSIPIVFAQIQDPVGLGIVASLARPGGNITGFAVTVDFDLIGKWLQMMKAIAPDTTRATILFNPETVPYYRQYLSSQVSSLASLGIALAPGEVRTPEDIAAMLASAARTPGGSFVVPLDPFNVVHLRLIAEQARQLRLPSVSAYRQFANYGGLLAYGPDIANIFRRSASYIDRVLKGASPAELPVQAPTKFETVINLKTATAMGLTVPPTLLATADEVIE